MLWNGEVKCKCGRSADQIFQDEKTLEIAALCFDCKKKQRGESVEGMVLYGPTALDVRKDLVSKVVFEKINDGHDRRGTAAIFVLKEIPNEDYARREAVELAQFCYMLSNHRYCIHDLGKEGEQADCWINYEPVWRTGGAPAVVVRDKYWGESGIKAYRRLVRVLAELHGWEIEDHTQSVLERLAQAVEEEKPQ